MMQPETIHAAEAMTASHAAIFQIRAAEYDAIPEDRPIARAIAAAALRRERAALEWAGERLATIRKYAAYEGIAGHPRTAPAIFQPAPVVDGAETHAPTYNPAAAEAIARDDWQITRITPPEAPAPIVVDVDARAIACPRCAAQPGERCHKDGRPQTRNHDARTRAALLGSPQPAPVVDTSPIARAISGGETRRSGRLPAGRVTTGAGLIMIAREDAKHTAPALRTPAQDALIQIKPAYAALLTERYNLRQAEDADADAATIAALRIMAQHAEEHYSHLAAIAQPAIDAAAV